MLKKSISTLLVAMLLLGIAGILPVKAYDTKLYIDPAATAFDTTAKHVGDTFDIYVDILDVSHLYGYEFKLEWEFAKVELESATRPAGNFMEPVYDPANFYAAVWKINETRVGTIQTMHLGYVLLAPELGRTGSGILVKLTFKILVAPPWMGSVTTTFHLVETKLPDDTAHPILHDDIDGTYTYNYATPTTHPFLSVNPATTIIPSGAPVVGTVKAKFVVSVDVNNLAYDWWGVGLEFKLAYNDTLIQYDSMVNDTWLDAFGNIYKVPVLQGYTPDGFAYLLTGVVLLPHTFPPSHWNNPISGTGHLFDITFEVIYQEAFPWTDSSKLDLYDTKCADIGANPVTMLDPVDGQVIIKGFVVGRNIDLYTQYPEPYGGQGLQSPSDMFWPQKQVELYANVTYNLWPVQNKIVAFEIHNPAGEIVDILTAVSDENGVAHTSYRIPWPCFNTSALFGIWHVIATVDISCIVVNDTMDFHFDYLIEWVKVTVDKDPPNYAHGDVVHVTVDYATYAIQYRPVLFTCVLHDELNYPVGKEYKSVTVGDQDMNKWCQLLPGEITFDIPIPKSAAAGVATLHINALSDFPWFAGSAWCEELTYQINILPA
jgi:hypothetical protein